MAWIKLESRMPRNVKVLQVPRDVRYFHLEACCWAGEERTNGFIPESALGAIGVDISAAKARRYAALLEAARRDPSNPESQGLWARVEGGWQIHGYLERNPTAEAAETLAETKATVGRLGGLKSGETRRRQAEARKAEADVKQGASRLLQGDEADSASSAEAGAKHRAKPSPSPSPSSGGLLSPPEIPPEAAVVPTRRARPAGGRANGTAKGAAVWAAYAEAYRGRYGADPARNAEVNRHLARLVDKLGAEDAPAVAAFYVRHNLAWYVQKGHGTRWLVEDAGKLHTEWTTGRMVTATQARQTDQTGTNAETLRVLLADRAARREAP